MQEINNFFSEIKPPVLILTSKIGLGHYKVALEIQERLKSFFYADILFIEDLLTNFSRTINFIFFRKIYKIPLIINISYYLPIFSFFYYIREILFRNTNLDTLKDKIYSLKVNTIITTSYKTTLYLSILKHRKELNFNLWICLTHYSVSCAWRFLFWSEVDKFFIPIEKFPSFIPKEKIIKIKFPVNREYTNLANCKAKENYVLISGGGWGLGPIYKVITKLIHKFPDLELFIVCGENRIMYNKLINNFFNNSRVHIFSKVESLLPFMKVCKFFITRPGAVSMTEGYEAKKKVFLLKDSLCEAKKNAKYGISNFNMELFSMKRFLKAYVKRIP